MKLVHLILKAVAIGTAVSALVLNILGSGNIEQSVTLLALSVTCLAIVSLQDSN